MDNLENVLFSYSSLRHLECPKRFKLYMKYKLSVFETPALEYGTRRHKEFRTFLESSLPDNKFQEYILDFVNKNSDYYEFEVYLQNKEFKIHGFLDVILYDVSNDKTYVLELKTGKWDKEQLYIYKVLSNADKIFIVNLTKQTIEEVDIDITDAIVFTKQMVEKAKEILQQETPAMRPGIYCSTCPFAKQCEASTDLDIITKETLPKAIAVYHQLKSRLKTIEAMLKHILEETGKPIETENFKVFFEETPYYKLGKVMNKKKMIERIIQDGKLELLDFNTKKTVKFYPQFFKQLKRKSLKISEKEAKQND